MKRKPTSGFQFGEKSLISDSARFMTRLNGARLNGETFFDFLWLHTINDTHLPQRWIESKCDALVELFNKRTSRKPENESLEDEIKSLLN